MKKNVLISFVTDAETDLEAVFALNKILYTLSDENLVKFNVFDVLDYVCTCGDTWCGNREGYGCGKSRELVR